MRVNSPEITGKCRNKEFGGKTLLKSQKPTKVRIYEMLSISRWGLLSSPLVGLNRINFALFI